MKNRGKYKIGDSISLSNGGYHFIGVITGFFETKYPGNLNSFYSTREAAYIRRLYKTYNKTADDVYQTIDFITNDSESLIEYFTSRGYKASYVKEAVLEEA